jgi:SAM domain (Sterile alpha motif)
MDGRKSIYCGEIPARMCRCTLFVAVVQILDVQRFVENRIDLSVLPDLTKQDLEKLGVLLGDRRKMLGAIGDLGNAS